MMAQKERRRVGDCRGLAGFLLAISPVVVSSFHVTPPPHAQSLLLALQRRDIIADLPGSFLRRRRRISYESSSSLKSAFDDDDDDTSQSSNSSEDDIDEVMMSQSTPTPRETTALQVPTVGKILQFAIPAVGVWLCSPLLSMIDTSTTGLLAGTAAQAALNPATAVTDYSARCMSFLYTATTNMVATASADHHHHNSSVADDQHARISARVLGALRLSLAVGVGLGGFLFVFANPLLQLLIGNRSLDPAIFHSALQYVRIRSLGMPAAALIGTAQAACLGLRDARSPLNLILGASVVNLVLDLLLVGQPYAWIGGAAGAAWATIVSQYVAIGLFFRYLGRQHQTTTALKNKRSSTTRGLLAGELTINNFFRRPDDETTAVFAPYFLPVTTTQVGRCSTYIAMGHVVSSSLGAVSMAANQIITAIFYTLIPIADSLSLTAQSFLPAMIARKPSKEKARAIQGTITNLLKVSGMVGLFLAGIVACIPLGCRLFTTDVAVMALVRQIVPVLFVIFSLQSE